MKQAQVDEMASTAARLERDLHPGRWDDGVSDEEVTCVRAHDASLLLRLCRAFLGGRFVLCPSSSSELGFFRVWDASSFGVLRLEIPVCLSITCAAVEDFRLVGSRACGDIARSWLSIPVGVVLLRACLCVVVDAFCFLRCSVATK